MYYLIQEASELMIVTADHQDSKYMSVDEDEDLDSLRERRDETIETSFERLYKGKEMIPQEAA